MLDKGWDVEMDASLLAFSIFLFHLLVLRSLQHEDYFRPHAIS